MSRGGYPTAPGPPSRRSAVLGELGLAHALFPGHRLRPLEETGGPAERDLRGVVVALAKEALAFLLVRTALDEDLGRAFPRTRFTAGAPAAARIWVNATPLGMKGFPDRSPAPERLPAPEAAVDLVYGRRTPFLRDAAARGARVESGAAMLVYQALRAWEFWDRPLGAARREALAGPLIEEVLR